MSSHTTHPERSVTTLMNCQDCGDGPPVWRTCVENTPVETAHCHKCDAQLVENLWVLPLGSLTNDNCINCTDRYKDGVCGGCGLTNEQAYQHHDEILDSVHASGDFVSATAVALKQNRPLVALKLATASAADNTTTFVDTNNARVQRIAILNRLAFEKRATDDATTWTKNDPDNNLAIATLGRQLIRVGNHGMAVEQYILALKNAPNDHQLAAEYANLMMLFGRIGQARKRAVALLTGELSPKTQAIVIAVLVDIAQNYHESHNFVELDIFINEAKSVVAQSGELLVYRAAVAASHDDDQSGRDDIKAAKKLGHSSPVMISVSQHLGVRLKPWWKIW